MTSVAAFDAKVSKWEHLENLQRAYSEMEVPAGEFPEAKINTFVLGV